MPKRLSLSGCVALTAGAFLSSCGPVEVVTVQLKAGAERCEDDVNPIRVKVGQGKREMVVWRIHNGCGGPKTLQMTLKDKYPVTDCGISPPKPNFTTIDSPFTVADGEITNIYCTHHEGANEKEYRYRIMISGSGITVESHELDIGVTP
jgi:hypothetical protein